MKQVLALFVFALLVSGCETPPIDKGTQSSMPQPPKLAQPKRMGCNPYNPQQANIVRLGDESNPQQALVIGNSEYEYSRLINPPNDAKDMANSLKQMGFSVTHATNLNLQAMKKEVSEFGKRLSDTQTQESVGLFYFSGHGAQVDGENFLIPTNNCDIQAEADLKAKAVHVQKAVLITMEEANKGVNLLVLDACRDNPYHGSDRNGLTRGLAQMLAPRGALIAFATKAGNTTPDGKGRNGLYTEHLLKVLSQAQHERIDDVFMRVRKSVYDATGGKQEPWSQSSLKWPPFCIGGCQSPK
jgi:uncharacterized caspase-like protein